MNNDQITKFDITKFNNQVFARGSAVLKILYYNLEYLIAQKNIFSVKKKLKEVKLIQ